MDFGFCLKVNFAICLSSFSKTIQSELFSWYFFLCLFFGIISKMFSFCSIWFSLLISFHVYNIILYV